MRCPRPRDTEFPMTLLILYLLYALVLSVALGRAGHRSRRVVPETKSRDRPKRVLIIGASGGTGRELVAEALERGYQVTAFVRHPAGVTVEHPHLTVVRGDVLDAASLDAAVPGHEAVVSALGHNRYFYPTRILSEGTRNILHVMARHRVPRFVCETSLGIGDSAGRLGLYYTLFTIPVILPFYYWDKTRQERIIERSTAEWVIVRPGLLTKGPRRGGYRYGSDVGSFLGTVRISRADVADFMLDQLESDACLGAAPGVA